jgi:hypothetical protein
LVRKSETGLALTGVKAVFTGGGGDAWSRPIVHANIAVAAGDQAERAKRRSGCRLGMCQAASPRARSTTTRDDHWRWFRRTHRVR